MMVIRGQMQRSTITIDFAVSGERGNWVISILAPVSVKAECETKDFQPWRTLSELLDIAFEGASHSGIVGGAANR